MVCPEALGPGYSCPPPSGWIREHLADLRLHLSKDKIQNIPAALIILLVLGCGETGLQTVLVTGGELWPACVLQKWLIHLWKESPSSSLPNRDKKAAFLDHLYENVSPNSLIPTVTFMKDECVGRKPLIIQMLWREAILRERQVPCPF